MATTLYLRLRGIGGHRYAIIDASDDTNVARGDIAANDIVLALPALNSIDVGQGGYFSEAGMVYAPGLASSDRLNCPVIQGRPGDRSK